MNEEQIRDPATGRFIAHGESVPSLGPPGVGKTHLAVAVGRGAVLSGYTVPFTTAPALVANLAKAHLTGRLKDQFIHYIKPKLLIVDELGYLPPQRTRPTCCSNSSTDATSRAASWSPRTAP